MNHAPLHSEIPLQDFRDDHHLQSIETKVLDTLQKQSLIKLWNNEFPLKLAHENISDLDKYLSNLSDIRHILLVDKTNNIFGWTYSFKRDNERWFAILLSKALQGKGYGKILLDKLKSKEDELNGWVNDHNSDLKADGQTYISPLRFYEKSDFKVLKDQRLETEKMSAVKIKWTQNKDVN